MTHLRGRRLAAVALLLAGALAVSACASQTGQGGGGTASGKLDLTPTVVKSDHEASPDSWCGKKPLKIGHVVGYGGNTWRTIEKKVVEVEAAKCPAVDKDILYANANGDQQKGTSDINAMVAQGVNVLLIYPDFGPAQLPALRAATKAGVTVVTYNAEAGGTIPTDYAGSTTVSTNAGESLAKMAAEGIGEKGNVVMIGGAAGDASSTAKFAGVKKALADYPNVKLIGDSYVATNWNKVDAQKAVAGLIASGQKVDALISDYGVTATAAIAAFQEAGVKIPFISVLATNNELGCLWKKESTTPDRFEMSSVDYTLDMGQLALRQAVAIANGKDVPRAQVFDLPEFWNSEKGKEPGCNPALPPDTDLSSPLTEEQLTALLK